MDKIAELVHCVPTEKKTLSIVTWSWITRF